jgi:hypothetical protein
MRHQEWAGREEKTCYVLSEHIGDDVPFPVPRPGKRIHFVACIGADGTFLKPLIANSRKTIDRDITSTGLSDEKVAIYSQRKAFIDRSPFWARLEYVFIPESCQWGARYQYVRNIDLIMDNCTAHSFPSLEPVCIRYGITIC